MVLHPLGNVVKKKKEYGGSRVGYVFPLRGVHCGSSYSIVMRGVCGLNNIIKEYLVQIIGMVLIWFTTLELGQ